MPRKARVEFAGAVYHVLDRGDRREAIVRDDTDREDFLPTLGSVDSQSDQRSQKNGLRRSYHSDMSVA